MAGDGQGIMKFSTTKLSLHKYYKKLFNTLKPKDKKKAIKLSQNRLSLRLGGRIGVDMSYSTKSAFSSKVKTLKYKFTKNKINILICAHDFYDNPILMEKICLLIFVSGFVSYQRFLIKLIIIGILSFIQITIQPH